MQNIHTNKTERCNMNKILELDERNKKDCILTITFSVGNTVDEKAHYFGADDTVSAINHTYNWIENWIENCVCWNLKKRTITKVILVIDKNEIDVTEMHTKNSQEKENTR